MPVSSFEDLCLAVCELADLPGPQLQPDAHATLGFSMQLSGIVLSVLELQKDRGRRFFLLAEMGEPPQADAPANWRALLAANAFLPGPDALHFSRHPASGTAMAQWACRLDAVTAVDVYQRLKDMQQAALQWQRGLAAGAGRPGPQPAGPPAVRPGSGSTGAPAAAGFHALRCQVHAALGKPAPVDHAPCFALQYRQLAATLEHMPQPDGDFARVAVRLDASWDAANPDMVAALLEASFALMSHAGGAVFCLVPGDSPLQLQHVIDLRSTTAPALLRELSLLAQVQAQWRRAMHVPGDRVAAAHAHEGMTQ